MDGDRATIRSPRIIALRWGRIETEVGQFRDAKLWPGGGRDWDWHETGTGHTPGVQPADVAEVLDAGARIVVLGLGQQRRVQVTGDTLAAIAARGAQFEALPSGEAVERYNGLAEEGLPVGALIHSTC